MVYYVIDNFLRRSSTSKSEVFFTPIEKCTTMLGRLKTVSLALVLLKRF
jgi:hypothetical protein